MRPIRVCRTSGVCAIFLAAALSTWNPYTVARAADAEVRYAGARVHVDEAGAVAVYGAPMTEGATPHHAAAAWLVENAAALGAAGSDLRLQRRVLLSTGQNTALAYRQYIDGVPVEYGVARLMVRSGRMHQVVYAAGRLVAPPKGGFLNDRIDGPQAVAMIQDLAAYAHLTDWSAPELVIYQDEERRLRNPAERAWKFTGVSPEPAAFDAQTFFVSAADGALIHVRSEVYTGGDTISGRVTGLGSPGTLPDAAHNPPAPLPMPNLVLVNEFGSETLTDVDGNYSLSGSGPGETQIEARFDGPWVKVSDSAGPVLSSLFQSATPPGPADFVFNASPIEFSTAQINAFIHTNRTHDFLKDLLPGFTDIDVQLGCNVNLPGNCNAFFTPIGPSINFFSAAGRCVNSAYSSVVAHEVGHFVVFTLGLRQGAFGEGFGDALAILIYDDAVVGRDFFGPGTFVRDIVAADKRYPCFGEIHDCGQVLAGVWWDIKEELQGSLGEESGLGVARQLFADWMQITTGGSFRNSAHPLTAVEVLTVDDDDGDLANGTPNSAEICSAFVSHNIPCPGECEQVRRFRVTCRTDRTTAALSVRATVVSRGSDEPLTLTLDGADPVVAEPARFGRATAAWDDVTEGAHEVCIQGCEGFCRSATCTSP